MAESTSGVQRRGASRRSSERLIKPLVFVACLLPAAWLGWQGWEAFNGSFALGANPIRELEIQTGLWTLRLLAVTLAITPLRKLSGYGKLARYRRMLGLFVFFYACIHLSLWVGVDWFFDWGAMWKEIVKHKYILVGMTTFLCLIPLALTSTKGWVRRLGGARWNRLHQLVYVCAIGGTVHYLWAVKKDTFFPLIYIFVFALLLGYRVWERVGQRRKTRTADASLATTTKSTAAGSRRAATSRVSLDRGSER